MTTCKVHFLFKSDKDDKNTLMLFFFFNIFKMHPRALCFKASTHLWGCGRIYVHLGEYFYGADILK